MGCANFVAYARKGKRRGLEHRLRKRAQREQAEAHNHGTATHDRAESGQDGRHATPRATGLPGSPEGATTNTRQRTGGELKV